MSKEATELTLHQKLAKIQVEFKASKSRFNSFAKYKFRSAEDILEALKPFINELDVTFRIEESVTDIAGLPLIHSKAIISDGKDEISADAYVGVDLNQKGMQVPQQFGSASSYGKKYSLGNLLLIDDTQDSDATNTHSSESKAKPNPIPEHKLTAISKSIADGKVKKDKNTIDKLLAAQGFIGLTDEQFKNL